MATGGRPFYVIEVVRIASMVSVVVSLVGGCTRDNPEFGRGGASTEGTEGTDATGPTTTNDDGPDEESTAGDTRGHDGGGSEDDGSESDTSKGDGDSSTGGDPPKLCQFPSEPRLEVDVQNAQNVDEVGSCNAPLVLQGVVVGDPTNTSFTMLDCGGCECPEGAPTLSVSVLPGLGSVDLPECVRLVVEYERPALDGSEACLLSGITLSRGDADDGAVPLFIGARDVAHTPFEVGGFAVPMVEHQPCECPDAAPCVDAAGYYGLDLPGGVVLWPGATESYSGDFGVEFTAENLMSYKDAEGHLHVSWFAHRSDSDG